MGNRKRKRRVDNEEEEEYQEDKRLLELPGEILMEIVENCSLSEWKSLRSTCRQLRLAVDPLVCLRIDAKEYHFRRRRRMSYLFDLVEDLEEIVSNFPHTYGLRLPYLNFEVFEKISLMSLVELYIDDERFKDVESHIALLPRTLKKLRWKGPHFEEDEATIGGEIAALPPGLEELEIENWTLVHPTALPPNLKILVVKELRPADEWMKFLPETMTELSFCGQLTDEGARLLPRKLHSLELQMSPVTSDGAKEFPPNLTRLMIAFCPQLHPKSLRHLPLQELHVIGVQHSFCPNDLPSCLEKLDILVCHRFHLDDPVQVNLKYLRLANTDQRMPVVKSSTICNLPRSLEEVVFAHWRLNSEYLNSIKKLNLKKFVLDQCSLELNAFPLLARMTPPPIVKLRGGEVYVGFPFKRIPGLADDPIESRHD